MTDEVNDSLLVDRAKRGDRDAFSTLVERHLAGLRKFLWRLGSAVSDLDDLTQETLVVLVSALPDFRGASSFRTFLFGIAVNVARRARRKPRLERELGEIEPVAAAAEPGADDAKELAARLRAAVARLPEPHREAFVLRHVEDLPAIEVARILGVPEGSVRRLVFEARERLRWTLEPLLRAEQRR